MKKSQMAALKQAKVVKLTPKLSMLKWIREQSQKSTFLEPMKPCSTTRSEKEEL